MFLDDKRATIRIVLQNAVDREIIPDGTNGDGAGIMVRCAQPSCVRVLDVDTRCLIHGIIVKGVERAAKTHDVEGSEEAPRRKRNIEIQLEEVIGQVEMLINLLLEEKPRDALSQVYQL